MHFFFKLLKIGWVNFETPLKRLIEQKLTKFGQDTKSDLGRFRTSKAEQARRREMMKSKNAETARRELLSRDRTRPLTEGEIETELKRLQVIM